MSSCAHWIIPNLMRKFNAVPIPVVKVSPDQFRFFWHKDYDLLTHPCHPPLALPGSLLLRPQYWQTFWSLTIPPKAITPWFCLLLGYIPTAALQHAWNPSLTISPLCRLCKQGIETSFHLFASCPLKLNFWFSIFERYSLPDKFLTADEIWSVLTSFVSVDEQTTVDTDVLCFFGAGISTVGKYHWWCVFDGTPWYTIAAVNSFDLEHSRFLSTLPFERKLSSTLDA